MVLLSETSGNVATNERVKESPVTELTCTKTFTAQRPTVQQHVENDVGKDSAPTPRAQTLAGPETNAGVRRAAACRAGQRTTGRVTFPTYPCDVHSLAKRDWGLMVRR